MQPESSTPKNDIYAQRFLDAVDLIELGIALMRQNIARKLPDASEQHVDFELQRWLMCRESDFTPQPEISRA